MKPKNGDIYIKGENQVIIFHGAHARPDAKVVAGITAVFGGAFSGNFGVAQEVEVYIEDIAQDYTQYVYAGNISDIFRGILCKK